MNKTILIIGALLVLGVGGFVAYSSNMEMTEMKKMEAEKTEMAMKEKEAMAMKEKEMMMASSTEHANWTPEQMEAMKKEEAMKGDTMMKKEEKMVKSAGMYIAYDPAKLALAKDNKVVIFFHAPWCPTCRALEAEINSAGVKSGVVILKADYDSSKELKAKYGVTSQHTFVQVDASGNKLNKWSGGSLSNVYASLK